MSLYLQPTGMYVNGMPVTTDENAKTGDILSYYRVSEGFFRRGGGLIGVELEKLKFEVAHKSGSRIARMYADGRRYQITNQPVHVERMIDVGSFEPETVIYQVITSLLVDPMEAEIGEYCLPNFDRLGVRSFHSGGYDILNKKTGRMHYFRPGGADNRYQRVEGAYSNVVIRPDDIEIEDS